MKKLLIGVCAAALLLVAAPMALPRLVNWNDYRDELARRVGDATGRTLVFDGDLGLQLLPAPALTAENIKIKAPPGFSEPNMAVLKRLEVHVALLPLLSGRIQVESVVAVAPQVIIQTDAQGRVNWRVRALGAATGGGGDGRIGPLAQLLSFDQILLEQGRLQLIDDRAGARETFDKIDMRIAAGSLNGPFQASGGVTLRGAPLRLEATTGRFAEGAAAPVRLAVMLPGGDPERLSGARFAGIINPEGPGARLQGELRVEGPSLRAAILPMRPGAALSDKLAKPFALRATVEADDDRARLDNLEIALGDTRGAGAATLALGGAADLTMNLLFNRVDLDAWAPRRASGDDVKKTRPAAILAPASPPPTAAPPADWAAAWPEKLRAKIDLTVDAANYAGGLLRQGRLSASINKDGVTVDRLAAQLPGGGAAAATGVVVFAQGAPRADFRVEASADNLRGLLTWLRLDLSGAPADHLRKAALAGRLTAETGRFELSDVVMQVDAAQLRGGLKADLRDRVALGLRLEADRINLDDYLPTPAAANGADKETAPSGAPPETPEAKIAGLLSLGDLAVQAQAQEVIFGGRIWRGVTLDAVAAGGGLEIRDATAEDANGGRLRLAGQAESFAPLTGAHVTAEATSPNAVAALAPLLTPSQAALLPPGPGALRAKLTGDRDKLAAEALVEAGGAKLEIGGEALKPLALLGLAGGPGGRFDLALRLRHADADALFALAGRRAPAAPGPFDVYAKLAGDAARMSIADVKGIVGGASVAGSGRLDRKAVRAWVEADVQTGVVDIDRLLDNTAAPAAPAGPASAEPASAPAPARPAMADLDILRQFDGRFAWTAAGVRVGGASFGATALKAHLSDGRLAVDRFDAALSGGRVGGRAELTARRGDRAPRAALAATAEGLKLTERLTLGPLALTGGVVDAETDLTVADPLAGEALRRLSGSGRVVARGGTLKGVDLTALRDRLQRVDRPQTVVEGVLRGLQGGETKVSALDASFSVEDGVMETSDARLETPAGGVSAVGRVDLARRVLDMLVTVEPDVDPPLPPLAMRLTGPLDAPTRSLDVGGLQRRLLERLGGAGIEGIKPPAELPARIEAPARDLLRSLIR